MPITTFSLAVVGADYPNRAGPGRRFEIAMCTPGEPVALVPEPNNPVDPRAVAVHSARGIQIGYLSAERCGWIARIHAGGRAISAIFQEATRTGAVVRVAFDGDEPVLPPPRASPLSIEEDWCPDEVWPDE